jgi:alpha-amylase/alpha-mannosidase (GH57 family)
MERFLCIHGHFYQPPRENPWLEAIELQDSATPYHDWNERITAECYAPNATARIMDGNGNISEIVSNYSKISFNFGPTVLAWMRDKMPDVHQAVVDADRLSRERFGGHGSALAQVYNHMIMPLANDRDKYTQAYWGIRDFEFRFGRKPEGMWLSETAADVATFSALAQQGIKFTILSPFQASRTREIGKRNWRDVNGARIDPTRPYLVKLPNGQSITVFFYDAPVSQAVAFERLLTSGERFAHRLTSAFNDTRHRDQLVHIATDGESYGHHHRHGEMALAYALRHIEEHGLARLTNYAQFLEGHPPTHEVQIHEKSAWSCPHGVGRWMTDCGCNSGGHGGWNQAWRTPLRHALDWLRDELAPLFERKGRELLKDPWAARNGYISVILDRFPENLERYFLEHATRPLNEAEKVHVLKLMELQRHAMLMYTSCGWFFDEVSGLESVQVVQYAARAIQLASELFGRDLEPGFLELFQGAKSNIPENCDGRCVYNKFVKPAMVDFEKATAHYAISSVFHAYAPRTRVFSFTFEDAGRQFLTVGKTRLAVGRATITSEITHETQQFAYAILYLGEHNLTGGIRQFDTPEQFEAMFQEVKAAYEAADFPQAIRLIDRHFGDASYSLKSLFKDELRRILQEIMSSTRDDLQSRFRLITERYTPLMKFLQGAGAPLPSALQTVSDFVLYHEIRTQFDTGQIELDRLRPLIQESEGRVPEIFDAEMSYCITRRLQEMMEHIAEHPEDLASIGLLCDVCALVMPIPMGLNLWKVQNSYWEMLQRVVPKYRDRARHGDELAREWLRQFAELGQRLSFAPKHLQAGDQYEPPQQQAA